MPRSSFTAVCLLCVCPLYAVCASWSAPRGGLPGKSPHSRIELSLYDLDQNIGDSLLNRQQRGLRPVAVLAELEQEEKLRNKRNSRN